MKNKYLTKCLCITMISAMVMSSSVVSFAEEAGQTFESGEFIEDDFGDRSVVTPAPAELPETPIPEDNPSVTPTPEENPSVTPTPGEDPSVTPTPGEDPSVTPTPGEDPSVTPTPGEDPSVTPTPGEDPSVTPTPGEDPSVIPTPGEDPSVTPTPGEADSPLTPTPAPTSEQKVQELIKRIDDLYKTKLSLNSVTELNALRTMYDSFTEEEKAMVTNYKLLVSMEEVMERMTAQAEPEESGDGFTDGSKLNVINGTPVYFTNMVSNLHAGNEFYLNSLLENYQLSFSTDFAKVMDEIESEYKKKNNLADNSDVAGGVTTSADTLLVRNWQDILAVYVYEQSLQGASSFHLDETCKEALASIFEEMNPIVRDEQDISKVSYGNYHINHYIKKNQIAKSDRIVLKKYLETDCKLLCAIVTGAKGFVRQSVGDDVSEERVNVITAAYSLVGKVGYFWGGKSTELGMDPRWGSVSQVTAEGSKSTGTLRAYGLDCSGFVTWSVINGYQNQAMISSVGNGTSDQWVKANVVSEADAQPGDLVFQRGPEAGSDNHVGIICGITDAGDWIAVHCSSSKNGVTVGEAYSASFRYIRQPSFYPTDKQVAQMRESGVSTLTANIYESNVNVSNSLQEIMQSNLPNYGDMDTITVDASGNAQILPSNVYVTNGLQEVFESSKDLSIFSGVNYADAVEMKNAFSEGSSDTQQFTGITVTNSLQELLNSAMGMGE